MAQCAPKSFDLTGKVALITGASYGIGMAIAKAMAANGATIVFNDIKQELVDKGLASYAEAGIKAHGYVCDVTDEDAVNAMVAKITEEVGHINILVNNAGIIKRIPMTEMSAAQFRQVIDVDLNAPFIVAKAIIPDMIAQGADIITCFFEVCHQYKAMLLRRKFHVTPRAFRVTSQNLLNMQKAARFMQRAAFSFMRFFTPFQASDCRSSPPFHRRDRTVPCSPSL